MARTAQDAHGKAGAQPDTAATPAAKGAETTPARSVWASRLSRVGSALAPRAARTGTTATRSASSAPGARPRGSTMRFFVGMLLFVIGSQVVFYIEAFAVQKFAPGLATARIWSPNAPLVGGLTPYLLIYFLLVVGLWYGLYRSNIIPKDVFGMRAQRAARDASTTTVGVTHRTRAERRQAAAALQAKDAAKSGSSARRAVVAPPAQPDRPYDAIHERVRAQQRARRRHDARR